MNNNNTPRIVGVNDKIQKHVIIIEEPYPQFIVEVKDSSKLEGASFEYSIDTPRIVGVNDNILKHIVATEGPRPQFIVEISETGPKGRSLEYDVNASLYKIGVRLEGESQFQYIEFGEAERLSNEGARIAAENLRDSAEINRNTAEGLRDSAETLRLSAEEDREVAEGSRDSAEVLRLSAETARNTAEGLRASAESGRVTAESNRNVFEAYNPLKTYVANNKVALNGSSYLALVENTGKSPDSNPTEWLLIARKGDTGVIENLEASSIEDALGYLPEDPLDTQNKLNLKADSTDLTAHESNYVDPHMYLDEGPGWTDVKYKLVMIEGKAFMEVVDIEEV